MRLVFLGLSLSSSWGNGHATTYRALLRGLAARGHDVLFLERDQPWYAANRDLAQPDFCTLALYDTMDDLVSYRGEIAAADAVIVGSYVPQALAVMQQVRAWRRGLYCFYDIDTPVTLRKLAEGDTEYLAASVIPEFDLYLSFTGGPALQYLERQYRARCARALYCAVDTTAYCPTRIARRWDLGYLGTYSADRQPVLERLLLEPARRLPDRRFVVAGPQYPADIVWPDNVERIEHLAPAEHADFYSSLGWALNVTRADMVQAGYSPSVRLFEATACGTPVITDPWPGLDSVFASGTEMIVARSGDDVLTFLAASETDRSAVGRAGRQRTLRQHSGERRAAELEALLTESALVSTAG